MPTREANLFFAAVEDVFAKVESAERLARDLKRSSFGQVTVGVVPGLATDVLPRAAGRHREYHPEVGRGFKGLPPAPGVAGGSAGDDDDR